MHQDNYEASPCFENSADALKNRRQWMDVGNRQHASGAVETIGRQKRQMASIGHVVMDMGRSPIAGYPDQFFGRIDARHFRAATRQRPAQHPLAAGDVDDGLPHRRTQKPQHARNDHFAVIFASGFAHQLVIPIRHVAPIGTRPTRFVFGCSHG